MLVLSRKPGEKILIGDSVAITVVRIGPNTVRLGIEAPRELPVIREELDGEPKTDRGSQISEHVEVEIDLDAVGELLTGVLDTVREPIVDLREPMAPMPSHHRPLKRPLERPAARPSRDMVRL